MIIYKKRIIFILVSILIIGSYLGIDIVLGKLDNSYLLIRDKSLFVNKKLVALTFDDGPSNIYTLQLLNGLKERNARVSFFFLGSKIINNSGIVKKAFEQGHTIGSHTYSHKVLTNLSDEEINYEINYTNKLIKDIIGCDVKYIRVPYGSYNSKILNGYNKVFILWSVDTLDWKLKNSEKIADYIVNNVNDGDIVLLHDIHKESVEGVLKAIDILQDKGYAFVSLDEMVIFKGIDLEVNAVYRRFD